MNILKSRYSELDTLLHFIPNLDSHRRDLFRGIYLTQRMSKLQESQWKEILNRKRISTDHSTFLSNLLITCQNKNRSNILLLNIDLKTKKFSKNLEDSLSQNACLSYICQSSIWIERRTSLSNEAFIYLFSEFLLIECLSRKRQLFIQLSGSHETFYSLPYYITRTTEEKKRAEYRLNKVNTRKRTIQFHLHATRQGQQAHLTDLSEVLIERNLMYYHVSKYERFDIHHSIEKAFNGEMIVEVMFSSKFSQTFFSHRPKDEVVRERSFSRIFDYS